MAKMRAAGYRTTAVGYTDKEAVSATTADHSKMKAVAMQGTGRRWRTDMVSILS